MKQQIMSITFFILFSSSAILGLTIVAKKSIERCHAQGGSIRYCANI